MELRIGHLAGSAGCVHSNVIEYASSDVTLVMIAGVVGSEIKQENNLYQ